MDRKRIALLIIAAFLPGAASAETMGEKILKFISTGGSGDIMSASLLATLSNSLNLIALSMMAALAAIGTATYVIQTANKGTPGGQVISSFWAPLRITIACMLLIPLPNGAGYSALQTGVIKVAEKGSSVGDDIMGRGLDYLYHNGAYLPPTLQDSAPMILGWITSEVCAQYVNSYTQTIDNDDEASKTITKNFRTLDDGSNNRIVYSYDMLSSINTKMNGDPRIGYCGKISVDAIVNEWFPSNSKVVGASRIRNEFKSLVSEFQPEISSIAGRILVDEKPLRALELYGKSAQAAYESARKTVSTNIESAASEYISLSMRFNLRVASKIATIVNDYARESAGVSWLDEIKSRGWPALGTLFWQASISQERINTLAKNLSLNYQQPEVDKEFASDERFIEVSMRVRGMAKAGMEIPKSQQDYSGVQIVSIKNSGGDGEAGIKSMFAGLVQGVGKAFVLGDSDNDIIIRLQHGGSQITALGEAFYWGSSAAVALADGLEALVGFTAEGAKDSATAVPLGGALFGLGATAAGAPAVGAATTASSLVGQAASFFRSLLAPLLLAGFTLAVVLPTIPLFFWMAGVVSWMLFFIECLLVSPMWLAAHGTAEKEGWGSEHTRQGYMLMIGLFLAPTLRVVGFCAILLALRPLGWLVEWFFSYMQGVIISGWISPLLLIGSTVVCAVFAYTITTRVFSLPNELFERGLRWINGGHEVTGDESSARQTQTAVGIFSNKTEGIAGMRVGGKSQPAQPGTGSPKQPPGGGEFSR